MRGSIKIVPAVLTDSVSKLNSMLEQAKSFTNWVQIDLMDGIFVPSISIKSEVLASAPPKISWEAHIMVEQPELEIENLVQAGAKRVIFHYEATGNHHAIINILHDLGVKAGIALNPETDNDVLKPLLDNLDSVLFMSVNPGYYGAPFIPEVLKKAVEFKKQYPQIEIGIDGGAKANNISLIAASGPDYICVGSAIFLNQEPAKSYHHLVELANT